jgi:hypothetical protein
LSGGDFGEGYPVFERLPIPSLATVALALALTSCAVVEPEPPPAPPCGVTPDGDLTTAEWQGAQRYDLADGVVMHLIQAPDFTCFGFETRPAGPKFVDLFVTDGAETTHNLHASMQVGERTLPNTRWTDEAPPTNWGQTTGWYANTAPRRADASTEAPIAEQLEDFEGYEFIIARSRMPRPWRVRVEVRDFEGRGRDIVWPAQSRRTDRLGWALFQ